MKLSNFSHQPSFPHPKPHKPSKISIKPPPPDFDFRSEISLVLDRKELVRSVPEWRSEFVEVTWLVGTTRISQDFAVEVERVVRAVKRDNVVVELWGQTALALRLLLVIFSSKISSDTNRPFGDEFRAARKASEELERAWNSLNWDEKLSLLSSVVRGITSHSDMSEKSLNDELEMLYEQLSFSYPSLLQPLIYERDTVDFVVTVVCMVLKRSKAVNKSKRVVGVIGKGRMNGRPTSATDASCNGWIVKLVQDLISLPTLG
ncbi:unnamed protein product [Malus baccata var. baccata]